jgi:hypothetical protein
MIQLMIQKIQPTANSTQNGNDDHAICNMVLLNILPTIHIEKPNPGVIM